MLAALGEREQWLKEQARTTPRSRAQTIRDLEDLGSREESTQRDYVGRYPIELLQNAHDACVAAGAKGTVHFEVTRSALLVANHGTPFDAKRVKSLVRQGMSEKAEHERKRTIGYKGVGFSSVFEISDQPQVICANGVAFGFDRSRARTLVAEYLKPRTPPKTVAARNFPFLLNPDAWEEDGDVITGLLADGFVTVIRLPLKRRQSPGGVFGHLRSQLVPETMVFLPGVGRLSCRFTDQEFEWTARSGSRAGMGKVVHVDSNNNERTSWLIHSGTIPVSPETVDALDDPAWRSVGQLRVTVGLPWAGRRVDASAPAEPVHVYFPTSETTGRSCLVHGDFYVDSRRSQILDRGPAAEVNQSVAHEAARLIAELAEGLAVKQAPQLLAALALKTPPSAFGKVLNAEIIAALRKTRLGRPADGTQPRIVEELALITSDQPDELDERLMAVMSKRRDLVRVDDYRDASALDLLRELGINELDAAETAARVTLANSKLSYERGLILLGEWVANLSYTERTAVLAILCGRKIVQDINGRWCRPEKAVLSAAAVPPLPEQLRQSELKPVASKAAREFLVDELEVEPLDAAAGLDLINAALDNEDFGQTDDEKQALHDWLLALWQGAPRSFDGQRILNGRAPVRVRAVDGESNVAWGYARSTYFGADWTSEGTHLEVLYGPDRRLEFLAKAPPHGREELLDFYFSIGVSRSPRWRPIASADATSRAGWRLLPDVKKASVCPHGHTTQQELRSDIWDRLDEITARACKSAKAASALTALILESERPLGEDCRFKCTHSAHRQLARPRPARGYQAWRFATAEWLPVTNDPAGQPRRAPSHTWAGVPRSAHKLLIPRAQKPGLPAGLNFIAWESPAVPDVEQAMANIQQAFPDLSLAAPAAAATADILLRKLESALTPDDDRRDSHYLPARNGTARTWSTSAVIPDIPGLEQLPGIDIADVSVASSVRHAYALQTMSETVTQHVHPGATDSRAALLPRERRLEIIVLLGRKKADRKMIAAKLGELAEKPVDRIDLEVIVEGQATHWSHALPYKLIQEGTAASLYTTAAASSHRVRLAQGLADHLNSNQHADLLALILSNPQEMAESILENELEEASDLLSAVPVSSEDTHSEPPAVDEPQATAQAPVPDDAEGGQPSRLQALAPPPRTAPPHTQQVPSAPSAEARKERGEAREPGVSGPPVLQPVPTPRDAVFASPVKAEFADAPATAPPRKPHHRPTEADGSPHPFAAATGVPRSDELAERTAIEYVQEYAERVLHVQKITDRQRDKCGWDLEFTYGDGRIELVEVKGSNGEGPFGLTVNELTQAKIHDNYVLYFLAEQATGIPKLYRFDEIGARIRPDDHLRVSSWWVSGWKQLNPDLIDITFG